MDNQLLREKEVPPTEEVLKKALKSSYGAYSELIEKITAPGGIEPVWNYYNDGKAWLCKMVFKKKTVFWLSVWDGFFKAGFYFTEKNSAGIMQLDIDNRIREEFRSHKPTGKLLPLPFRISKKDQLKDLMTVIEYKKTLK